MKLSRAVLAVLLPLVALAGCGDEGKQAAGDTITAAEVAVVDDAFEPEAVTVEAGATTTWRWEGSNAHDVSGEGFTSEVQTSGSFEHTFDEAGEFVYRCTIHSEMRATVIVR